MFEDDKWDNKKMVNRFAEIDESSKEIQEVSLINLLNVLIIK